MVLYFSNLQFGGATAQNLPAFIYLLQYFAFQNILTDEEFWRNGWNRTPADIGGMPEFERSPQHVSSLHAFIIFLHSEGFKYAIDILRSEVQFYHMIAIFIDQSQNQRPADISGSSIRLPPQTQLMTVPSYMVCSADPTLLRQHYGISADAGRCSYCWLESTNRQPPLCRPKPVSTREAPCRDGLRIGGQGGWDGTWVGQEGGHMATS